MDYLVLVYSYLISKYKYLGVDYRIFLVIEKFSIQHIKLKEMKIEIT